MSPIGSPFSGSYTYPQFVQMYFFTAYFLLRATSHTFANIFRRLRPWAASGPGPLARGGFPEATLATFARSLPVPLAGDIPLGGHSSIKYYVEECPPLRGEECPRPFAPQAAPGNPPHRFGAPRLSGGCSQPVPPSALARGIPCGGPPWLLSAICRPISNREQIASTRRSTSPVGGARRWPRWSARAPSPSSR
jgi:hypothetical protein